MRISDWSSDVCSSDLTIKLDQLYSTPDQSHSMMEPHATTAAWNNDKLTIWTSNQMIAWAVGDLAQTLRMPKESIHVMSPFIGGGFGGKLWILSDGGKAEVGARDRNRVGWGKSFL